MVGLKGYIAILLGWLGLLSISLAADAPATSSVETETVAPAPPQATATGAEPPKVQTPATTASVSIKPSDAAEEANLPPPPNFTNSQSPCTSLPARSPHLAMSAKTKTGERYYRVSLGCIPFTLEGELLDEKSQAALDEAVAFLLGREDIIRIYIDMATFGMDDRDLETRFRQQAFAVKKYLTHKGVYSHLKSNRDEQFPPFFDDEKERLKAKLAAQQPKPAAPKTAAAPTAQPRKDISRDYTFAVNRSEMLYYDDTPTLYRQDPRGGFQFVPLDSVYFPHDGDALSARAKATLDIIADYVQSHPETDRLIIKGNADEAGTEKYNYRLTDRRADAVREYLIAKGVSAVLVELLSAGEADPVDENWNRPGRARNRRVELFLVQRLPIQVSQSSAPAATTPEPTPEPDNSAPQ